MTTTTTPNTSSRPFVESDWYGLAGAECWNDEKLDELGREMAHLDHKHESQTNWNHAMRIEIQSGSPFGGTRFLLDEGYKSLMQIQAKQDALGQLIWNERQKPSVAPLYGELDDCFMVADKNGVALFFGSEGQRIATLNVEFPNSVTAKLFLDALPRDLTFETAIDLYLFEDNSI